MPIAKIQLPDGRIARFEVPEGSTQEDVMAFVSANQNKFMAGDVEAPESTPSAAKTSGGIRSRARAERKERRESEREASLQKTAERNPVLADLIREMGTGESLVVGAGGGFNEILAGTGLVDISPEERGDFKSLTEANTSAQVGRFLGQSLPFAGVGGVAAGAMRGVSLAPRIGVQGAIGAAEGGIIAKGTGGKIKDIAQGAALGGLIGGAAEAIAPLITRGARSLINRVKGRPPKGAVIDDVGRPTPELKEALEESGESFDDIVREAERQVQQQRPATITKEVVKSGRAGNVAAAKTIEADPRRVQAAENLGVEAPIGVLTKDQAAQELTGALAAIPTSRASSALDEFTTVLGQRADNFVEELGGSTDRAILDSNLLDGMQSDISRIKAVEDKLYDGIRGAIGDGTIVNAKPVKNLIATRGRTRNGVKNLSKVEKDVYKRVKGGKLTYGQLNDIISDIGAALGRETDAYSTVQKSKLSDMYGKLSQLREGVAGTFGQAEQLRKAKEIGAKRFGIQEATKSIYGKDLNQSIFPRIDRSIKGLDKGLVREFEATMELVPKKYRKPIAATMLNTALTGGRDASLGVNSGQFAKWYRNLERSPTAMASLKKYIGDDGMKRFDDIAELAKGVAGVTKARVRTGVQSEVMKKLDDIGGITGKLYSAAQKIELTPGGQLIGKPVTAAANIAKAFTLEKTPAVEAADSLLASKAFRDAVMSAKRTGVDSPAYKAKTAALKKTPAYKKYIRQLDETAAGAVAASGLIPWLAATDNTEDQ